MCQDKAFMLVVSICVMQLAYNPGVGGSEMALELLQACGLARCLREDALGSRDTVLRGSVL